MVSWKDKIDKTLNWINEKKWIIPRTYNLPRLNYKEIENLNSPITSKEVELVIRNFPTNKSVRPDGNLSQTLPKNRRGKFPNSF